MSGKKERSGVKEAEKNATRRRGFSAKRVCVALIALALSSCGLFRKEPPPPPSPTVMSLTLNASPTVNPDESGNPKPITVRVYRLAGLGGFLKGDFYQLRDDPEGALGRDLIAIDEYTLAPGGTAVYQSEFERQARFIAITGAYSRIDEAKWKAYRKVPREATSLFTADFGAEEVKLREAEF